MTGGCPPKDKDPKPLCGANLHTDDATCGNGKADPGELCLEPAGEIPVEPYETYRKNLELADFNGDGHLDLRIASVIHAGHGDGSFAEAFGPLVVDHGNGGLDWASGDFDGDGLVDLAFVDSATNPLGDPGLPADFRELWIWRGSPELKTSPTEFHSDLIDEGMYPTGIAAADLDEDGRDDLIVPIRASDYYIYEAGIFLRHEGGLFQASGRVRADSTICLRLGWRWAHRSRAPLRRRVPLRAGERRDHVHG